MSYFKFLIINVLSLIIISCGGNDTKKKPNFSITTTSKSNTFSIDHPINITLNNPKGKKVDSVSYSLNGIKFENNTALKNFKLGKHPLIAKVYFDGETESVNDNITLINNEKPKIYTFKILNTYPHDITSYTQGLEFFNGNLYESTGQRGESKLRQLNYKTGEVIKNIDLAPSFFGEGLTVLNDKIYQLTWQSKMGFVYDVNTFDKLSSFKYGKSVEGWGLCNDNKTIYKSDGTHNIWQLNPETLAEENHIQVYTNTGKIGRLNELEWVNGKIYANIYQFDGVAIINPKNGATEAIVDFSSLKEKVTKHKGLDVINGMAYNPKTKTLFVTGKRWDKLFEVEIVEN